MSISDIISRLRPDSEMALSEVTSAHFQDLGEVAAAPPVPRDTDGQVPPEFERPVYAVDRKSTRLNSSPSGESRMPSSA